MVCDVMGMGNCEGCNGMCVYTEVVGIFDLSRTLILRASVLHMQCLLSLTYAVRRAPLCREYLGHRPCKGFTTPTILPAQSKKGFGLILLFFIFIQSCGWAVAFHPAKIYSESLYHVRLDRLVRTQHRILPLAPPFFFSREISIYIHMIRSHLTAYTWLPVLTSYLFSSGQRQHWIWFRGYQWCSHRVN